MVHQPKVSIIIPNYNYVDYLEERFRSILDQTYKNYEIIFLDDASTDASVDWVRERYGGHIENFVTNPVNSGNPFVQWNRGARISRGEYLWIAEADDFCAPDFLEQMLLVMNANPTVGLAYCNTVPVDSNGKVINGDFFQWYVSDLDQTRWTKDFVNEGVQEVRQYLVRKNTITNVSGVLFRRDAFINAGYAPENMRMCGDWLAYCRILHESDVAFINRPLNFHRQHAAKQTNNSVLNLTYFREFLQVQDYLMKQFNVEKKEKQSAFQRFLHEWSRLTVSNYGRINLAGTLSIARMTSQTYSKPFDKLVIALYFVINSLKSVLYKWKRN